MFTATYLLAELRRRKGRTLLTALGLGVGVGLVVAVSALSQGLDDAQDEVLKPLTGVGTDMSVTRPLKVSDSGDVGGPPGANLSASERDRLRQENGGGRFGLTNLGKPGEKFSTTNFVAGTQLSFPASEAAKVAAMDGVARVSGGLTLSAIQISGTVPEQDQAQQGPLGAPPAAAGGSAPPRPRSINFDQRAVTGVDASGLGPVGRDQVTTGRWFTTGDAREALLDVAYARRRSLAVGDTFKLEDKTYKVVGLVRTPIGGQASDMYVKLDQLQALADRKGRVNVLYVRAQDGASVGTVAKRIEASFAGASVTTSQDLADRVGGSLVDAKNLTNKLGTALTVVALLAAFLIAALLTLSSVTKRVRELGTLKALGWRQWRVVRQVSSESLAQGGLGGIVGAVIGIGGAAIITAVGPTLQASVAGADQSAQGFGPGGGGPGPAIAGFGQGRVASGTQDVTLGAPVDARLILLAIGLALLGGLLSGALGGLRAARLRPADALRHLD